MAAIPLAIVSASIGAAIYMAFIWRPHQAVKTSALRRNFMNYPKRKVATEAQRQAQPWIDTQGIALLLTAVAFALVLGSGALWIGLH